MRYLLDSNAVVALMAGHHELASRVAATPSGSVCLSSIVVFELMFGAFNGERVEENLARLADLEFPTLPFDAGDARAAGKIRAGLKQVGKPIGPYDILIAGQALVRNLTLITANGGEFGRVDGLSIENWAAQKA